jgi:DNA-binding NarL/FixJ family response regulator
MPNEKPAILFMDDEIGDPRARVVHAAIDALRAADFDVTTVRSMSEAIDHFYARFYKVFVLDIDMSHVEDEFSRAGERGTRVAELYRALDNGTAVVMFSMMGLADDWIRVGNRHVSGYVYKGEEGSVERLVELVRKAAADESTGLRLPTPRTTGRVVICNQGNEHLDDARLEALVRAAGDFTTDFRPFAEMTDALRAPDVVAGLIIADRFDARPAVLDRITAICRSQPTPHVVVACEGSDANRPSIVHIVNARPFRIVNLLAADAATAVRDAVCDAARWHGGNECFEAETEYVHRATREIDWDEIRRELGSVGDDVAAPTAGEDDA